MAKKSLSLRSEQYLESMGFLVWRVEVYNKFANKKKDLFNIADTIAIRGKEILLVQTTSRPNVRSREYKILESPYLHKIIDSGIKIFVHGWRLKKGAYDLLEIEVTKDGRGHVQDKTFNGESFSI